MTLPSERTRAVIAAREFLTDIMLGQAGTDAPKKARQILRHYPLAVDLADSPHFDSVEILAEIARIAQCWHCEPPPAKRKSRKPRQ